MRRSVLIHTQIGLALAAAAALIVGGTSTQAQQMGEEVKPAEEQQREQMQQPEQMRPEQQTQPELGQQMQIEGLEVVESDREFNQTVQQIRQGLRQNDLDVVGTMNLRIPQQQAQAEEQEQAGQEQEQQAEAGTAQEQQAQEELQEEQALEEEQMGKPGMEAGPSATRLQVITFSDQELARNVARQNAPMLIGIPNQVLVFQDAEDKVHVAYGDPQKWTQFRDDPESGIARLPEIVHGATTTEGAAKPEEEQAEEPAAEEPAAEEKPVEEPEAEQPAEQELEPTGEEPQEAQPEM